MLGAGMKLGVNVDHVATLRQARGTSYPSPLEAARLCAAAGAHNITAHLREDRRHIQDHDLPGLRHEQPLPLNLEMANTPEMIEIALELSPAEVCLVPERREELTTEGGLDAAGQLEVLRDPVARMLEQGIAVSLFIAPNEKQIEASQRLGCPLVELHTGTFCHLADAGDSKAETEKQHLIEAATLGHQAGLQVNAGHGINLDNIDAIGDIPHLDTLNIGHSIVARSVWVGMEAAVRELLNRM